jgi:murein DD-endopeptidase MepM/ murein hydrolase activator NlpD
MMNFKKIVRTAAFLVIIAALVWTVAAPDAAAADASSKAGQVTSAGNLNVRSGAGTSSAILTKLPSGSYVTLLWKTGNWWYVEYAPSSYGYASADYIKTITGAYPVTVSSAVSMLNVRSGPGSSYAITGVLPSGRTVMVLSSSGGWNRVLYNGTLTGYASAAYLSPATSWPVPASHKINQYFSASHQGLDIGASVRGVSGDKVVAAMGGIVVYAGTLNGYGNVVYINSVYNGQLVQMRYAHLSSAPLVTTGASVGAGQLIGTMGNTGTSSGVHLHLEVRLRDSSADCLSNTNSTPVNPLDYVK